MSRIIFTLIFLTAVKHAVIGQADTGKVSDRQIQEFFAWRTNHWDYDEKVKIKRVRDTLEKWSYSDFEWDIKRYGYWPEDYGCERNKLLDSILTSKNKEFISQQINQFELKNTWSRKSFKRQKLVNVKSTNEIHKSNAYWAFSAPLFTADKQFCFIKETHVCGFMCEQWSSMLYQRTTNGHWKLVMIITSTQASDCRCL